MKRLIVRAFVIVWLLLALCTAALIIGRLDHTPTPLQVVGFDTCAGEPCFRGIKPGMEWVTLQKQFPAAMRSDHAEFAWPAPVQGVLSIGVIPSPDQKSVRLITMSDLSDNVQPLPFSVGNLIAQYGSPCLVFPDQFRSKLALIYPKMSFLVFTGSDPEAFRLRLDTPVWSIYMGDDAQDFYGPCDAPIHEALGHWYGFASPVIYQQRNQAAKAKTDSPGDGS